VLVIARRALIDLPTSALAVLVSALLWKVKKIPEPVIILLAAGVGILLKW